MTALSDSESKEKLLGSSNAEGLLKLLKEAIEHAAEVIEEFRQKSGMAKRLLKYSIDADAFKEAQQSLGDRMTVRMPSVLPLTHKTFHEAFILFCRVWPSTCLPECRSKYRPSSTSCWRR